MPSIVAASLVGGVGSARFPLGSIRPKILLPVGNEPILVHQLRAIAQAGIKEFVIVLDAEYASFRQEILQLAAGRGVEPAIIETNGVRGSGGALKAAEEYLRGAQCALVFGAGVLFNTLDIQGACQAHRRRGGGISVLLQPQESLVDEDVELREGDRLIAIRVPHVEDAQRWRSAGVYLVDPRVLQHVPPSRYLDIREQVIPLLNEQQVGVHAVRISRGCVYTIRSLAEYCSANHAVLRMRRASAPGAGGDCWIGHHTYVDPAARIIGPVVIGNRCRIDAGAVIIGPACIGDGCHINSGAVVRESVIWGNTTVGASAQVEFSLAAEQCVVPPRDAVSRALLLPDSTQMDPREFAPSAAVESVYIAGETRFKKATAGRLRRRAFLAAKRALDFFGAVSGMFLLLPLLLLIALAVKLDSPGPIFFVQPRVGQDGRIFHMYKFRSMVVDAHTKQAQLRQTNDVDGPMFKLFHDPRLTRLGRLLRATSLDELPQLINVLRGDMSLVGPRPLVMSEMTCAPAWRDYRLMVKPGLTGLWQISGRSRNGFDGWVRLDIAYVKQQSLWLDFQILWRTFSAVIRRVGAV